MKRSCGHTSGRAGSSKSEAVGSTVEPYKLLEQIGGGGMGIIHMAEQLRPVRRKVALKIIIPGVDDRYSFARERHVEVGGKYADAATGRFGAASSEFAAVVEVKGRRPKLSMSPFPC